MQHPSLECLAQIITRYADGRQDCGSGYLVTPGWVVTAAHVVRDAITVQVWLGAPPTLHTDNAISVEPGTIRYAHTANAALLPISPGWAPAGFVPVGFGLLDRDSTEELAVRALGFPWFKLRPRPGTGEGAGRLVREVAAVAGTTIPAGNVKTGTLTVTVSGGPDNPTQPASPSPADQQAAPARLGVECPVLRYG